MEAGLARYLVRHHSQQQDLPLDLASLHRKLRRYADGDHPSDDDYPALSHLATPEDLLPAVWKLVEHQGLDVDTLALGSKTLVMLTRIHSVTLQQQVLLRSKGPAEGTVQSGVGMGTLSTTASSSPPLSSSSSPRVASASLTSSLTINTNNNTTAAASHDIAALLEKPTALEASAVAHFKKDAPSVRQYCPHGTRLECDRRSKMTIAAAAAGAPAAAAATQPTCSKLHFRRVIEGHTDVSLGDCAYLSTCRRTRTCKYIHYEIEEEWNGHGNDRERHGPAPTGALAQKRARSPALPEGTQAASMASSALSATPRAPAQWVNVDVRNFDLSVLGQFQVIMADPPWEVSKWGLG